MKLAAITFFVFWVLFGCNPYQGVYPEPDQATVTIVTETAAAVIDSPQPPSSTPRPTCTVTTGVPAGSLNIRTGAGVEYGVIDQLQEGDELIILARGAWLQVETPSHQTGWINSKYCK